MKALINGKILLEDGIYEDKVLIFDEKIRGIVCKKDFKERNIEEIIDTEGRYISPGFIDIHIHGSGGSDTMDGTIEALKAISSTIVSYGTTGFLPTTMTMDMPSIYAALDTVKKALSMEWQGAKVLGAHMEGPFINSRFRGAQRADYIITPEYDYIKDYIDIIKIITIAPEIQGSRDFIASVQQGSNATLAIGHTAATYEEAMEAIEAGMSHCTHLFNAMTPLHHRNPGVVGAAFNSDITCELIADKIHVHPEVFKLLLKIKGEEKLILVTDAMRAGCMKDGAYELGGQQVQVKEGKAQLTDGSLAGSALTLNQSVKNFMLATKSPLHQVIKLVSLNPARVIGMERQKGSIAIGKDADIIVFDDNIKIKMAFVEGCNQLGGD
ncbi:N-acetylglucosamine 6-phosphate deacetylase [Natronincola peptidivorans]|uniref:N-acetylglucosamine-6-phosphate deacetylase n=1 Tax=Natronincola peptidivorans TaxID=426128 RepID=A0A1I0ATU8_9FIRM|nr:N-acetylglucosamine-6-phosphate deacetylase [Natronincola peptidivorans]SES96981.1 N-acetylglucosamine 6-phosphate deacetylase [Natronincola peptidivorans]